MSRSDGAKESCDCSLLMSLCGFMLSFNYFFLSLQFERKAPSTIGAHIPLPCVMSKALFKEAIISSSCFIKNTVAETILFQFHPLMVQLAYPSFYWFAGTFAYQFLSHVKRSWAALSHYGAHDILKQLAQLHWSFMYPCMKWWCIVKYPFYNLCENNALWWAIFPPEMMWGWFMFLDHYTL